MHGISIKIIAAAKARRQVAGGSSIIPGLALAALCYIIYSYSHIYPLRNTIISTTIFNTPS
jgi:hypothetical protein